MIYTVTLNPAIDYVVHPVLFSLGATNRSLKEEIYVGGKGINVSLVLKELGVESRILGFTAGFTGAVIEEEISKSGLKSNFVRLKNGFSRINVKIKSENESEINGCGPKISEEEENEFLKTFDDVKDGDTLILSGSVPPSASSNIYEKILRSISERQIKLVVDASGKTLLDTLKYSPFLIKPNESEIEETFGVKLRSENDIISYAEKLKNMGAKNVLVSRAEKGAILIDEYGKVHFSKACKGEVKNSVGAGDSMVAGFIVGTLKGDFDFALKLGIAAGAATAFSNGLATKGKILSLLETL